jgi:hypothetical protein
MMAQLGAAAITLMAIATPTIIPATTIVPLIAAAIFAATSHITVLVAPAAIVAHVAFTMVHPLITSRRVRTVIHLGRSRTGQADACGHEAGSYNMRNFHEFPLGPGWAC